MTVSTLPARSPVQSAIDSLAIAIYTATGGNAPDLILKRVGIATPRRRPEFYTLDRILRSMPSIEGSILECGTYRGATLLGMTHIVRARGFRTPLYGFDSFEGFPEPSPQDAQDDGRLHPDVHQGALGDTSYPVLLDRIQRLGWNDQVTLVKGFFENTLSSVDHERFSMVHLDCDLYDSYRTCLEFAYPRMLPGSFMVFDDYKLPENVYPGADRAVDEFFADKPEKPERFPHPMGLRSFVRIQR